MKQLLIIAMIAVTVLSCKKENPQPKDGEENTAIGSVAIMKFIQIQNSQPIHVVMTDSLGYTIQGNLNDCRAFYDIQQLDRKYYFLDATEDNKHMFTVEVQQHNGMNQYIVNNSFLGYFLSQTPTQQHCGSDNSEFDFEVGISKQ